MSRVSVWLNEAKNYKDYIELLKEAKEKKEIIIYELSGVKGIDYSKIPGSYNPHGEEARKEKLRSMLDEVDKEIDILTIKRNDIGFILRKIRDRSEEDWRLVTNVISGIPYRKICSTFHYSSPSSVKYRVDKIVAWALDDETVGKASWEVERTFNSAMRDVERIASKKRD